MSTPEKFWTSTAKHGQSDGYVSGCSKWTTVYTSCADELIKGKMNRKIGKSTVRFGPALKAVLICLVTCSLGLGYVWQKQQINTLGGQIKENEIQLEELRRENKRRGDTLAFLMSGRLKSSSLCV